MSSQKPTHEAVPPQMARLFTREAIVLLVMLLGGMMMLRPSIHGNDGVQNYAYVRSLLLDGDLDFTNEYQHYISKAAHWFDHKNIDLNRDPRTNLPVNLYGVGSSLMWTPAVAITHLLMRGTPGKDDGFGSAYERAISYASCFYASLGVWLLFLSLRRFWADEAALAACVGVWLASPLFFYTYLHPSMSHANSFFLAALLMWLYTGGDGLGRWAGMGATYGLLVITRYQDASLLVMLLAGEVLRRRSDEFPQRMGARVPRYFLFGACAAVFFLLQMCVWKVLHGSFFSGPRGYMDQGRLNPLLPVHFIQVLFSPRHGLFYWHPILLAAVAGLLIAEKFPRTKLVCLAGFAAALWLVSSWSIWWAGSSFGHRMFISCLPLLAFGAADIFSRVKRGAVAWVVIVLLVFWNFGYAIQYGTGMIDRQEGVSLVTLARNNLVEIPRLALRRLTDN